jgi:hypothetical protein
MGKKSGDISDINNNSVPDVIFIPNKISRYVSSILIVIIDLIAVCYAIRNRMVFTSDILINFINFGATIVLAIMALAVTVLQTEKGLLVTRNSNENVRKVYLSFVFSVFPIILLLILGYLIAQIFEKTPAVIGSYFILTVFVLSNYVAVLIAAFVCFFNIRD